ncbi:MAG: hypothetical protein MJ236_02535 [Clostridia bacterium]|nr:hypothetical protein [Clostridia bacterium]
MGISYDTIEGAFLSKITEYEFIQLATDELGELVDGYMKRAASAFKKICKYDLSLFDDEYRCFTDEFEDEDIDEIVEIISEGMLVQWMKPYVYQQDNLQNVLNTRDFSVYSPAELLMRIGNAYQKAQKDYTQMVREYSYNHGDLTTLHL